MASDTDRTNASTEEAAALPQVAPDSESRANRLDLRRFFAQRLSFRTQMLLVFVLCLVLGGVGVVLVNLILIEQRKKDLVRQSVALAEEQARRVADDLVKLVPDSETTGIERLRTDPALARRVEMVFHSNDKVVAVCVVDADNEVVFSEMGGASGLAQIVETDDEVRASLDVGDLDRIEWVLRRHEQPTRRRQVDIVRNGEVLGQMRFLISESALYREIEAIGREISRGLWSVFLAFVGVLALAVFLMERLARRHVSLIEANQRLDRLAYVGTLAAGLAHEIRNPLNGMSVNLSVAEEEAETPAEDSPELVRRALGLIRREIDRLNRTVSNFMEFAYPGSRQLKAMELRPLVEGVLDLLQPQIEAAGIEVEVDLPDDDVLRADYSGLRQVVYNVALNAVQAMAGNDEDRPRRLEIGGRRESAQWVLWVEDTGPGLPPGEEQRIFELFHTTKSVGSGYGLSIAERIIAAHDGDIRARQGRNGGTRIEITLPETGRR